MNYVQSELDFPWSKIVKIVEKENIDNLIQRGNLQIACLQFLRRQKYFGITYFETYSLEHILEHENRFIWRF